MTGISILSPCTVIRYTSYTENAPLIVSACRTHQFTHACNHWCQADFMFQITLFEGLSSDGDTNFVAMPCRRMHIIYRKRTPHNIWMKYPSRFTTACNDSYSADLMFHITLFVGLANDGDINFVAMHCETIHILYRKCTPHSICL